MIHRLHAIGRPSNRISQVLSSWNISRIEVESKQLPFSCLIGNSRPKSSLSSDTQEKKTLTFKQSMDNITHQNSFHHQRVWKAEESGEGKTHDYEEKINFQYWKDSIDKEENEGVANPRLGRALERIGEQVKLIFFFLTILYCLMQQLIECILSQNQPLLKRKWKEVE